MRPLAEMIDPGTVAAPGGIDPPSGIVLRAGQPNPFLGETTIQYALPRTMAVRLVIHDARGRMVRTLVDGIEEAGERRAVWDGRDARGSLAGAGVYVCRLEAGGAHLARKVTRLQ
jgi:hypothetical protein